MAIVKHATSPAGERIEIIQDADWVKSANLLNGRKRNGNVVTDRSIRIWQGGMKRFVIADLWRNGPAESPKTGIAPAVLWGRIRETFGDDAIKGAPASFTTLARDAVNTRAFELDTRAKRTYSIRLKALPQTWYDKLIADEEERQRAARLAEQERERAEREAAALREREQELVTVPMEVQAVTPSGDIVSDPLYEPTTESIDEFDAMIRGMQLDAPTVYDTPPPLDISIASQVAMSLLTTVVEIISAGSGAAVDEKVRKLQGDLNDVMGKLSARLEDNDRMRRQLRQAGDEINALRHERDGLRSRLRATEANLTAALKGDAVAAINGEIQRRVDSIMRVAPKAKGGDDE